VKSVIAWGIAAAVSGCAAAVVVHHGTPIDRALPLIVVIVTGLAALSHPSVHAAVPLLIAGEIAIPDERLRLTWFGLVLGVTFAGVILIRDPSSALRAPSPRAAGRRAIDAVVAVAAIVLLRWIPFSEVLIWRELLLIAIAVAIVFVYRSTPLAIAIAIAVALFTPAVPLRTFVLPISVLVAGLLLRAAGMPEVRAGILASTTVALIMTFFAWSGAFARALPLLLSGVPAHVSREPVHVTVGPGETKELAVPRGATAIILSGANVPRLKRGALLGYIDPGRREVRIGDVADWGTLRREQVFASRNPLPRDAAGLLRGYGQTAWIDGTGRVPVPRGADVIHVTGSPTLAFEARLQVDAFELGSR
jgi:hypothetical protein